MNLELIKQTYNLHTRGMEGFDYEIIKKDNYEILYSPYINDCYCNLISNFDVKNKQELETIINDAMPTFKENERDITICVTPFMKNLYENREELLDDFELVSTESWMIYDWDNFDKIQTNCNYTITLKKTNDLKAYADCLMECYKTDDEDDPYGDLDDGYRQAYINYRDNNNGITNVFYFVKANGIIVGTTQETFNDNIYGIYGLALKKEYRGKGIGKEVLKKQLELCKGKNIKIAYIMTETGYYPNKMY